MRKLVPLALLLLVPATAQAGGKKLWLNDASRVTSKIAQSDGFIDQYAPDWTGSLTSPVCARKSRTRATCDYRINYTPVVPPTRGAKHRWCMRRVSVTLRHGRAVGHILNLDCGLQDMSDPDYEA